MYIYTVYIYIYTCVYIIYCMIYNLSLYNVTECVTLGKKHVTRSALEFDKPFRVVFEL